MAPWMKLWGGLTALGMAIAAASLLPPAPSPIVTYRGQSEVQNAEVIKVDLERELAVDHDALKRFRWSDSLSVLAFEKAQDRVVTGLPSDAPADPEAAAYFDELVRQEVDRLDRRDPDMLVGYFYQPISHGGVEGIETGRGAIMAKETYVGVHEGRPYCLQVRVVEPVVWTRRFDTDVGVWRSQAPDDLRESNYLGACRSYARYGMPGTSVQAWLEAGGQYFMQGHGAPIDAASRAYLRDQLTPFGWGDLSIGSRDIVEDDLCRAGDTAACLATILTPNELMYAGSALDYEMYAPKYRVADLSPLTFPPSGNQFNPYPNFGRNLLYDLENDFGTDAFAAFWSSDREVPEAFEAAFGMGMGEWTASWLTRLVGEQPLGPTVPRFDFLLSMLMVSAMGWVATATAMLRKVT